MQLYVSLRPFKRGHSVREVGFGAGQLTLSRLLLNTCLKSEENISSEKSQNLKLTRRRVLNIDRRIREKENHLGESWLETGIALTEMVFQQLIG